MINVFIRKLMNLFSWSDGSQAIDHEGIGIVVEFVHPNIRSFSSEEKICHLPLSGSKSNNRPKKDNLLIGRTHSPFSLVCLFLSPMFAWISDEVVGLLGFQNTKT